MVLIQLNIKPELDKKIKHYMIDNNIDKKAQAIMKICEDTLN